jgi:3-oxoacyl-[acyl-carrier-protein] synthase-1
MTTARGAEILHVGMVTSVGADALRTAAAVRAGISRFRATPFMDQRGEAIFMATVPDEDLAPLHPSLRAHPAIDARSAQMLRLAAAALQEVLADVLEAPHIPLLLALPETLPDRAASPIATGPDFLRLLATQSATRFDLEKSRAVAGGRAAGMIVLADALERLETRAAPLVLVGGVDSHQDEALLEALDDEDRLRAVGVLDGFTPGDGAAFLLLGPPGSAKRTQREPLARIEAAATALEPGHRYSQEPYRGDGLDGAFRALFARAPAPVHTVYAGLNGESMGAKEWGVAYVRHREHFADGFEVLCPAEHLGDTGAASGPLMLGLAAIALQRDYRRAPCLVWCSSDLGARGAAIVGPGRS